MKRIFLALAALLACSLPAIAGTTQTCEACATGSCSSETVATHILARYVDVSNALAADSLADAQSAATKLVCCLECGGHAGLAAKVEAFCEADAIADAREQFKAISAGVIPLVQDAGPHFVMTCPMAAADWIQIERELANPYYGKQMLRCGLIKTSVAAPDSDS